MPDYIRHGHSRQAVCDERARSGRVGSGGLPAGAVTLPFFADVRFASLEERDGPDRSRDANDVDWRDHLVQAAATRSVMSLSHDGVDALVLVAKHGVDVDLVSHARRLT